MMKLIKVSNENSKTLDSPKSFTKLIFRESKLINQITKSVFTLKFHPAFRITEQTGGILRTNSDREEITRTGR